MATILLRSPRYETLTAPSGAVSAKLELTLAGAGNPQYIIIKDCTAGSPVLFEIAELCRDYLTPAVKLSPPDYPLNSITISRDLSVGLRQAAPIQNLSEPRSFAFFAASLTC